jgi:hypothetical protein
MATHFFSTGLPQLPVNVDPKIEPDLRDVYNAIRNLAAQIEQYGGFVEADEGLQDIGNVLVTAGPQKRRVYVEALEAMDYGAAVNLTDTAGTLTARFANATDNSRPCTGINNTIGTCAIGDTIEVVLPGAYVTSIGSLVPGTRYFLSTSDGLISSGAPAAAGNIVEALGYALTSTVFFFFPDTGWYVL